ncbi:MAG TPA: ABC transporter permease [Pyrinomonadaceae bacterium]|nr:ABC transporter permease [Pyrinomonadaceae bacterium]
MANPRTTGNNAEGTPMILSRLILAGFGRRAVELILATLVIAALSAVIASSTAVIEGARAALYRFERKERPDVIHVIGRFNRALFELPRRGNLPPATLPVYEPRIEPVELRAGAINATIVGRQSLLRNVVREDSVSNVYIFGIDPEREQQVSTFHVSAGRFLTGNDQDVAVLDEASARSLGIRVGDSFSVRTAADTDLRLKVIGILSSLRFHAPPIATVPAPALQASAPVVTSGVFVPLRTSEEIFARPTLTDALVIAKSPNDVPSLTDHVRQQFRLNTGVFIEESYTRYRREVRDFQLTLALFRTVSLLSAVLGTAVVAALLHDVYKDRLYQYGVLAAVGFRPFHLFTLILGTATIVAIVGVAGGFLLATAFLPRYFEMPSLLANMGAVTPRFNGAVISVVIIAALVAVLTGTVRTFWILTRRPVARALHIDGP